MQDHIKEYLCKIETFSRRKYLHCKNHLTKHKRYNFAHVTYYASNNVGDTVLSDTVRKGFDQFFRDVKWELFDVSNEVTKDIIDEYNTLNALVIGGGGLFLPDTNKNRISGWQWPCPSELLSTINKPVILYAVGYNYFRGQQADELFVKSLNEIIQKSSFVGIRNQGSIREIKKLISKELRDKVVFQPCLTTVIRKLGYNLAPKKKNNTVAINLAFDRIGHRLGENQDVILEEIADAVGQIQNKGYEIYYVAHIVKDLGFVEYLRKKNIDVKVIVASSWSAKKLIQFYNNMDLVIGMRGHAQMIPFGVNCHIITLGSHDKMKWFLEDINALDWYIELSGAGAGLSNQIVELFEKIHVQEADITTKRLLDAQEKLYSITQNNFKTISRTLNLN